MLTLEPCQLWCPGRFRFAIPPAGFHQWAWISLQSYACECSSAAIALWRAGHGTKRPFQVEVAAVEVAPGVVMHGGTCGEPGKRGMVAPGVVMHGHGGAAAVHRSRGAACADRIPEFGQRLPHPPGRLPAAAADRQGLVHAQDLGGGRPAPFLRHAMQQVSLRVVGQGLPHSTAESWFTWRASPSRSFMASP